MSREETSPVAGRLLQQLEVREISIRALARRMNPDNPEVAKREILRWLAGTRPTASSIERLAAALEVRPAELTGDGKVDDE